MIHGDIGLFLLASFRERKKDSSPEALSCEDDKKGKKKKKEKKNVNEKKKKKKEEEKSELYGEENKKTKVKWA